MSREGKLLSTRHFDYIAARASCEDTFLLNLKRAALERGIPPIWIAPEQAALIQVLLRLTGARRVVEVGALAGYAAICMARALPAGGHVRTIEVDQKRAEFARLWTGESDVADRIDVVHGRGSDVLAEMSDASVDAILIDADKQGYAHYLEEGLRIVRCGGLVMVDNALAFGRILDERVSDPDVSAIRRFNDAVAADPRLQAVIVPLGDGLWVGVTTDRPQRGG